MFYLAHPQSSVVPLSGDDDSLFSAIFEFVFVFQPTIACSFSPHISHPLGFLTEQLVFGASWSGSNKEEETCLIDFDMCDQHEAIV
jgi:hypothetical protein